MSAEPQREPELSKLFRLITKVGASELNLRVGQPPMARFHGDIQRANIQALTEADMERLLYPVLDSQRRQQLDETGNVEFTHDVGRGEGRFRCRIARQEGCLSLAARLLDQGSGKGPIDG